MLNDKCLSDQQTTGCHDMWQWSTNKQQNTLLTKLVLTKLTKFMTIQLLTNAKIKRKVM